MSFFLCASLCGYIARGLDCYAIFILQFKLINNPGSYLAGSTAASRGTKCLLTEIEITKFCLFFLSILLSDISEIHIADNTGFFFIQKNKLGSYIKSSQIFYQNVIAI